MEVRGRKPGEDSNQNASPVCQPCDQSGKQIPAKGFCQTCCEYLCDTCYNAHTIPTPCKDHVLLGLTQMPKGIDQAKLIKGRKCTIRCRSHPDEVLDFYCTSHQVVLCRACSVLHHRVCNIDFVPNVAADYQKSQEYTGLKAYVDQLEQSVDQCLTTENENYNSAKKSCTKALGEVNQFRTDVNAYLDGMEQRLKDEVKTMLRKYECHVKERKQDCDHVKRELTDMKTALERLEDKTSDLFVTAKQMSTRSKELQGTIDTYRNTNSQQAYAFKSEPVLVDLLASQKGIGSLHCKDAAGHNNAAVSQPGQVGATNITVKPSVHKPSYINIKRDVERANLVQDIAIVSPSVVLIADLYGNSVKMVDVTNNTILASLDFQSPLAVTCLNRKQAAVTLLDIRQIAILAIDGTTMRCERYIQTAGSCCGISSTDRVLVVSYLATVGKIEVMDYNGKVLTKITNDSHGKQLFDTPQYVLAVKEGTQTVIYVSDLANNMLTKLKLNGEVLIRFTDKSLDGPYAISPFHDGQILVSDSGDTVRVFSDKGEMIGTLLDRNNGVFQPFGMAYCPTKDRVSLSNGKASHIQVYSLS